MCGVSVIIPVYNRKEELNRALRSVFNQTRLPDEVIVIDDGSTDDVKTMLEEGFPRVIYRYQENGGVSRARNHGIGLASSKWLAFLDSDDEWLPDKLSRQLGFVAENPQNKVCHTEEIWVRNGVRVNQKKKHGKKGGWIFKHCLPLCAMSPSSIMIHRDVFDSVGLFDESFPACEDYELWLRITAKYPVAFIDDPLIVKYGGHEDQLSRKYWGMDRFRIRALEKIIADDGLSNKNRAQAIEMLISKTEIYLLGAKKRGKQNEVESYEQLLERYR